ncbi:Bacterial membrane flanked domain protein [Nocardioides dokdonensis FR1436]|uniref:Bacterial membrane flanked domain protein n=1 Tax=Nocardioides dokdonensis FR1436 TaxID=1300347 RepID=A0A1A9GEG4_9ACTN|nr:PH domain-containing protein [Nocardioides dokdonensis]ANH36648.1 Bacterial membrane flanked domain protein [Nocardioides dokdonensis FR1436]
MADLRDPAHRVSPRARLLWILEEVVGSALVAAALLVATLGFDLFDLRWWMVSLLVALPVLYVLVVPQWRYAVHRWEATETAVYTQTGWWSRERRIAPMSRIQTVDYAQGPLERLLGLADVTVTTASAAGALTISALDRDTALRLVDDLTLRADAVAGDAT